MLDDFGNFRARAYTAGALPVEGATVRILGAEEANRGVAYSLITDVDGLTPSVRLPAPSKEYSMAPDPKEAPYSLYDLEISADGYFPKRIYGVMIFAGISSLQEINMIPSSDNFPSDYPRGNVNAVVR
ncbi:MAG: hypothetical protein J6Q85_00050 [Clostridia bacterium]|nr:hypothetical protein [Clostridia bacterium]